MDSYVSLAQFTKPFGLDGRVKATSLTSFPAERFSLGRKYTIALPSGERKSLTLQYFSSSGTSLILGFMELGTCEEAEALRGLYLDLPLSEAPLPKDTYRLADLIGLTVIDEKNQELGKIKDVFSYSSTSTLRVARAGGKDFFVPFIQKDYILEVNLEKGYVKIQVVPGLL